MRNTLRAFFVAVFAVLAFVIAHHEASAEVMISAEVPEFTDMYVGATYTVTVTQSTGAMDGDRYTVGNVTVRGLDGTGAAVAPASLDHIPAGTSQTFTVSITVNEALLEKCTSGTLEWWTSAQFFRVNDEMVFDFANANGTTPCSVSSVPGLIPVEVVPPQVTEFGCGIGDDTVTLYDQPTGVSLFSDSGWGASGIRTISYSPLPGYEITNQADYYFYDTINTCGPTWVTIIPPFLVSDLCGPNNDFYATNGSVEGVVESDSGWSNNKRTISYEADPGYMIIGDSEYILTDENKPCGGSYFVAVYPPVLIEEVCGPNNDVYNPANAIPANGATVESFPDWENNERTITYVPADDFQFTTESSFTVRDENTECDTPVSISAPTLISAICGPNNDEFALDMPAGVSGDWVSGWTSNSRTVEYSAESGYEIQGQHSFTVTDGNIPCVTPVPPTTITVCGANNDDVSIPDQPTGVLVSISDNWVGNSFTVTFSTDTGYAFPPDTQVEYILSDDADTCVSPEEPTTTAVCGENNDEVHVPSQQTGVIFSVSDDWTNGSYTVSFSTEDGFDFPPDTETEYLLTDAGIPCVVVTPASPTHTAVCGYVNDRIDVPDQPVGIGFSIIQAGASPAHEISFYIEDESRYAFAEDAQTMFEFDEVTDLCVSVIPPTVAAICGENNDLVTIPEQDENVIVHGDNTWADNIWNISFEAAPNFMFVDETKDTYQLEDEAVPCPEGVPVPPVQVEICGPNNDEVVIPDQPAGVIVESDGSWLNGGWTVTFSADEEFVLPDGTKTTFDLEDENTPCLTGMPLPPVQSAICGSDNDEVVIPDQPPGVIVESDDSWTDGGWKVTFSAAEGRVLPDGAQTTYELVDENMACPIPLQEVTVNVDMPNNASAEGGIWQVFAPLASQTAMQPYAEGEVGADNTFHLPELVAGEYRLTVTVSGYEPLDTTITIEPSTTELTVHISALQEEITPEPTDEPATPAVTPEPTEETTSTVTPTPTEEATVSPTAPAAPKNEAGEQTSENNTTPVTSLPETGSGSGSGMPILAFGIAASLLLGVWTALNRRKFGK